MYSIYIVAIYVADITGQVHCSCAMIASSGGLYKELYYITELNIPAMQLWLQYSYTLSELGVCRYRERGLSHAYKSL